MALTPNAPDRAAACSLRLRGALRCKLAGNGHACSAGMRSWTWGHALTRPGIVQFRWICAALVITATWLATMPLVCPLALLNQLQKRLGAPSPGALPARQRRLPTGPSVSSPVSRRSAVPGYTSQNGVPTNQLPKASLACLSASSRATP